MKIAEVKKTNENLGFSLHQPFYSPVPCSFFNDFEIITEMFDVTQKMFSAENSNARYKTLLTVVATNG